MSVLKLTDLLQALVPSEFNFTNADREEDTNGKDYRDNENTD